MIGTRLAQRYELVSELGRGGMGVVYLARDPQLDREVAIKVLSASVLETEAEDRFLREAQVVARMDHPSIVPIYDLGRHDDALFFVMPRVRGETLGELCRRDALALGDVLEAVAQVAEALDYSHLRGVVHRDVKPENVMMSWEDGRLRARVMDFGLALGEAGSRLTRTGNLPGTLGYLSPEQILGAPVDGRCDLYSLATILYECLAGTPPFTGARYALLYKIVNEEPPPLPGVEARLADVVFRCLAKNPENRPARGNELAAVLRRLGSSPAAATLAHTGTGVTEPPRRPGLTPLVGRGREVAELRERLKLASAGECQLVLVGGDPGMGKTRLLEELEQLARARGFRVLRGRFSDQEDAFPFQGFGELIQDFFLSREYTSSPASAQPDLSDLAGDLRTLLPALAEIRALAPADRLAEPLAGAPGLALAAARRGDPTHVFEILARALARIAGGKPTAFLLEHLHGAETSIEALQYVVRRLAPTSCLFAGSYRRTEVPRRHPLNRLLSGVRDEPRFSSIVLAPLGVAEIGELVAAQLGGGEVASGLAGPLHEATEGNPFFAQELVRSLVESNDVSRDPGGVWTLANDAALLPESLPETIQQAVESRLERLPEDLLEVLQVAAVLGRSFDCHDLEALVDEDAEDAVERLLAAGLLSEDRQPRSQLLHFASGVVCDVLHAGLSRRRRRSLHRRHARRLEERYAGRLEQVLPQLVHHYAAGDVAEKTVEHARELARRSLDAMATNVAVRALRTALDFVEDESVARATEGELRFLLARALRAAGANEAAVKAAARAVRAWEQVGETAAAAQAALVAAETAWQGRRVGETRRWVEKGIDLARRAAAADTLRRLLSLGATIANLRGEHSKARARWDEAQELAAASSPAEEPLPAGGTLVTSLPVEVLSLDPRRALTIEEREVVANVFEPLIEVDAEGHLNPCLCEEWEKAAGSRSFLVRLRRDVRFSDGAPLTAADVKAVFATAGRDRLPAACAAIEDVRAPAADEESALAGIEVLDDHSLRFRLREPLPIFPILLSDLGVAVFRAGAAGALVGTGPFLLAAHRRGGVRLERNPHYWRGSSALLDAVEMRTLREDAAAAALRSGEIDVGRDFGPDELDQLLRDPSLRTGLVEASRQAVFLVALNLAGPVTGRPEARRALVDAVRVQDVVWRTLGRFAQPASGLVPPGTLAHDPGRRRPHLSREEARESLQASGLELPVELVAVADPLYFDRYLSFTQALTAEWEALGVRIVFAQPGRDPGSALDGRGGDLWIGRWVADYDDPDSFARGLLHSRHGLLGSYLGSPAIDDVVTRARREESPAARQALYRKLESILVDDRSLLPLFYDADYRLVSPRIRGLRLLGRPPYVSYSEVAKLDAGTMAPAAGDSGVLHVPLPAMSGDLAPRQAQILGHAEAVGNVFETLTRLDEGARIVPCLASEFRLEDGGRRFRFKLRGNVRFHDGRRLTVRDVRFTFEELVRGLSRDVLAAGLVPIRGCRAFWEGETSELEGFTIQSGNEFVIHLERPLSFFPAMLTSISAAVVPEGNRRFDGNWRDGSVGTGPFRVLRFDPAERLELEAHPHYWRRGLPKCDRLVFELGGDGELLAELRAGRLSLAANLRPAEVDELLLDPALAAGLREMPGFSSYFLALNVRGGPLADTEVRRAFARVVAEVLERPLLGRLAARAQGFIPPGLLGHEPRPRRATEADDEPAASADALSGVELRAAVFPAYLGPYRPFWDATVQALERSGAAVRTVAASPVETLWRVARGEVDLAGARWAASYPDPDALIHFFHSRGYLGELMSRRELDELFDRGRAETDPALRHTIYRQIDHVLSRHHALIPLFHDQVVRVGRPELHGLRLRFGWPEVAYEELTVGAP